jgi:hypothetical protein
VKSGKRANVLLYHRKLNVSRLASSSPSKTAAVLPSYAGGGGVGAQVEGGGGGDVARGEVAVSGVAGAGAGTEVSPASEARREGAEAGGKKIKIGSKRTLGLR